MDVKDDKFLLSQSEQNDDDLISFVYYKYANDLFVWGKTFTNDHELIQDAIQDLFVYFLNNRNKLDNIQNLKVYLFSSLRHNVIHNLNDKHSKRNKIDANEDFIFLEDNQPNIEEGFINSEINNSQKKLLKKAFASLSQRQKRVIFLRYKLHMEYEEICNVLGIHYQSARTLIYRALGKMKETYNTIKVLK